VSRQDCPEAFERYRAGQTGPDALVDCLQGDGARWLTGHVSGLSPSDRDDLLQSALEALLFSLPRFRGDSYATLRSYFFAILRSKVADHFRRRPRERLGLSAAPPDSSDLDPAEARLPHPAAQFQDQVELDADLARLLSPEEYRVVRLKLEGFGDREVARILNKAPGTVASLYHRARGKIRAYLRGPCKEPGTPPPSP